MTAERSKIFRQLGGGGATAAPATIAEIGHDLSVLDRDEIRNLTPERMTSLMVGQLQSLSPEQIAILLPSQLAALDSTQVRTLTVPQIQGLTSEQIHHLTVSWLQSLSAHQIGAFTTAQVMALSAPQLDTLLPEQREALNLPPAVKAKTARRPNGPVEPTQSATGTPAAQDVRTLRITIYATPAEKEELLDIADADRTARRLNGERRAKAFSESEAAGRILRFGIEQMRKLGLTRLP